MKPLVLVCLLVVGSCYTLGRRYTDTVLDTDTGIASTDCSFETSPSVTFVCRRCQAQVAYNLGSASTFSITGMLRSVRDKVQEIVGEMRANLPLAEITFAAIEDKYCFYASSFVSEPDYEMAVRVFTAYEASPLRVIENFENAELVTRYVGVEARQGSGAGHYYRYMEYAYGVTLARRASTTLTLNLQTLTSKFEYSGAYTTYTGQAILDNSSTQLPFSVVVPYNRPSNTDYILHIPVRSQFRIGEFLDLLIPTAGCASELSLPAIPDMRQLPVLMLDMPFTRIQSITTFNALVVFFYMPQFALAPHVFLDTPTASIRINSADLVCNVAIDSTWRRENVPTLSLHINQSLKNTLKATGYINAEPRIITIKDIAEDFYTLMYPDPFNFFPVYNNSRTDIEATLGMIQLMEPTFQFTFTPEAVIVISGTASYLLEQDTKVDLAIGRVNGALESFMQIDVVSSELITRLIDAESIPLVGFSLLLNRISSSSVSLDLTSTSPLRPPSVPVHQSNAGFEAYLDLELNDQCSDSEYCSILRNSLGQSAFSINGRFVPDYFLMSTRTGNVTFSRILTFYNSVLRVNFERPRVRMWLEGILDIQGDSKTLVSFRTNVTENNGDARLEGILRGRWEQALDLPQLTFQGLQLLADVDGNRNILDSTIRGISSFGPCSPSDCWFGDVVLSLSTQDYTESYAVMTMRSTSPSIFFPRLLMVNTLSPLLTRFRFPTDMTVSYAYREQDRVPAGLTVSSQVLFMGIPAQLTCNGTAEMQSPLQLYMQMQFFTLGSGNIQVTGSYNSPVSSRLDYSNTTLQTTGIIVGTVTMWGLSQIADIRLTDTGLTLALPGYLFGGMYAIDMMVSGPVTESVTTANLTATGEIDTNTTRNLQTEINQSLTNWAQIAAVTLQRIRDQMSRRQIVIDTYQSQVCTEPCPQIMECVGEPQYVCTQSPVIETCTGTKQGCSQMRTTCEENVSTCMQSQAVCAVYDTQSGGNNCEQWDTVCVNAVQTCQGWSQECTETIEEGCAVIEHQTMNTSCLHQEFLCEQRTTEDSTCRVRCRNIDNLLRSAQTVYDQYQAAYNDSVAAFGALTELLEGTGDVFSVRCMQLDSIAFSTPLVEAGIGPGDIAMKVVFLVPSLKTQKQVAYSVQTKWSFFTEAENQVRLERLARQRIIQASGGRLAPELELESPMEIFERLLQVRLA